MPTDIDVIKKGLTEVWDTQGRRFVTFEADAGGDDDPPWIQYLDGELNVDWPLDEAPAPALARRGVKLPRGAFVAWHAPGENAIFGVGDVLIDDLAAFVAALFGVIGDGGDVTARVEEHD